MAAFEGSILRWLGLPSRQWRAWREVSLLAALFMELSWIAPWMHALLQGDDIAAPLTAAKTLGFTALVTYLTARAGAALSLKGNIRQSALILVLILAAPGSLSAIIYPGENLGLGQIVSRFISAIQTGESLLPNEFLVVLALLWVWIRSIRWAAADGVPSEMISRFKLGFVLLLAYAFAFTWVGQGSLSFFIYTFFFFAWLAMGSARLARTESHSAAVGRFFSPRWLLAILSAFIALTFFLVLIGLGIRAQFALIQQVVLFLWLLFWGLIVLLLSPFIVAISLVFEWLLNKLDLEALRIQPITNFIEEARESTDLIVQRLDNSFLQGILDWTNSLRLSALLAAMRQGFFWGVLVLILVLGLIYAGRRIGFWKALRDNISREETTVQSDDWWRALMAAWRVRLNNLRDSLARFTDPRQGRRLLAAARIRRVYTYLMDLSAELGSPRKEAQTPLEYMPTLIAIFPHHSKEIETISKAYMLVRYGEIDETPTDVIEVDRAWLQIRLEGEHIKKMRKKKKQEVKEKLP